MGRYEEILKEISPLLTGEELENTLILLPEYNPSITRKSPAERLITLSDVYKIYIPSKMSYEIYSKLYLALLRSLQKKCSNLVLKQQKINYNTIYHGAYNGGIIGGTDSFSIIGNSGIGKSATINRCVNILTQNKIIEAKDPYAKIIPCLIVQCPFDSSVRGLMLEILRKVDEVIGSNYYESSLRKRATTDILIGCVSQVALNNIGLLIIDEIQNVCNSKNGNILVGSITQLVNNSGISICFVGTPECENFFLKAPHLARRTIGLKYKQLEYGEEFINFCRNIFHYQYMKEQLQITDEIILWLYNQSNGNISNVIALFHDAQEIGIINNENKLSINLLKNAYDNRMQLLHNYTETKSRIYKKSPEIIHCSNKKIPQKIFCIQDIVVKSKEENLDIIELLKKDNLIIEVKI